MDHWSKFHILFPLSTKSAAEVGLKLQNEVFAILGTSRILHSDNGRRFVNEIIHNLGEGVARESDNCEWLTQKPQMPGTS